MESEQTTPGFNKGRSSKFREGSRVRQTPEEGWRTYRPKRCEKMKKIVRKPSSFFSEIKTTNSILTEYLTVALSSRLGL